MRAVTGCVIWLWFLCCGCEEVERAVDLEQENGRELGAGCEGLLGEEDLSPGVRVGQKEGQGREQVHEHSLSTCIHARRSLNLS